LLLSHRTTTMPDPDVEPLILTGRYHWTWDRNDARWDIHDPDPDPRDVADDEGWAITEHESREDRGWYDDLERAVPELPA
jgi:hypothetical protein